MASDALNYYRWRESEPMFTLPYGSACLIQVNEEAGAIALLEHLAKSNPCTVSFADPNSEQWHDAFDAFCLDGDDDDVILTIWNDGTPIEEVVEDFVTSQIHMCSDTGKGAVIELGAGTLIEIVQLYQATRSLRPD